MVILKKKIKKISSLPNEIKKKTSILKILSTLILIIIIGILIYIIYYFSIPYINAVKIEKIIGKKISYTDCNTKDYIIISKDKSYSLQYTDKNCIKNNYDGTLSIKYNKIYFNIKDKKDLIGIINTEDNYNISINNTIFEEEKNE